MYFIAECAKGIHADIMFGLYGISGADRDRVTEFVKSVGGAFDLLSGNVRIGLRETCGRAKLGLSEFEGNEEFIVSQQCHGIRYVRYVV